MLSITTKQVSVQYGALSYAGIIKPVLKFMQYMDCRQLVLFNLAVDPALNPECFISVQFHTYLSSMI